MKKPSMIILVIGLGLLFASLFAEPLGIGDDPGFGKQQTLGTAAGLVITVVGLFYMFRTDKAED
jgi:hypothetical protein